MKELVYFEEPSLLFRFGQAMEDPRDGLSLFGPFDSAQNYGVKYGIIGTADGIKRMKAWIAKIQRPVAEVEIVAKRPPFPGFEAAYGIPWNSQPLIELVFEEDALRKKVLLDDRHKRNYETVGFITSRIINANRDEDGKPEVWIVVLPEIVYQYCRPNSKVEKSLREAAVGVMPASVANRVVASPFLFEQMNTDAVPYQYDPDFRNQLKGRLLSRGILTQLVRESTVAHWDFLKANGKPKHQLDNLQSQIAWNISAAIYYKIGGRPWKLGGVRPGVCYVGLVFKQDVKHAEPEMACCAAQMFLDSGDGVVFKGNVGPWYSGKTGEYHLKPEASKQLLLQAIQSYKDKHDGKAPAEIFIHGKTRFSEAEWDGFREAAGTESELVGIRICESERFRLYRLNGTMPILRGLSWIQSDSSAMLMTRGYIPRLGTYPGMEVPKPLEIEICRGQADIHQVLKDILGLTKLNYNSCRYADGLPVTLKFADAVGEVLISGPNMGEVPLPFKHYI